MVSRPAIFDSHVLALDISFLFQPLAERAQTDRVHLRRCTAEETDHRHRRLLRTRRERCSDRRTSNHFDEIAPSHAFRTLRTQPRGLKGTTPVTRCRGWR